MIADLEKYPGIRKKCWRSNWQMESELFNQMYFASALKNFLFYNHK